MCHLPFAVAACLLLSTGCRYHHGPRAETLSALVQPAGVTVELRLNDDADGDDREVTGELLEVREDGVLLLQDDIVLVAYSAIDRLRPRDDSFGSVPWGSTPEEAARSLRLVSRYPHGMKAGVLERMLGALQQTEIIRVEP